MDAGTASPESDAGSSGGSGGKSNFGFAPARIPTGKPSASITETSRCEMCSEKQHQLVQNLAASRLRFPSDSLLYRHMAHFKHQSGNGFPPVR